MSLPLPPTFLSLSAKTDCYTFDYVAGGFAPTQNIVYVDCNGFSGQTQQVSAGQSGSFCARSITDDGSQITITNAGNCPCITWRTRVFNTTPGNQYTFSWLDCNGQPGQKTITTSGSPGQATFYVCANSKPVMIVSGGAYDIEYEAIGDGNVPPTYLCRRDLVG